jgi:hypothetical protein
MRTVLWERFERHCGGEFVQMVGRYQGGAIAAAVFNNHISRWQLIEPAVKCDTA